MDLYAVSPPNGYLDLATLEQLPRESGGMLVLYPGVAEASMPRDVHRVVSRPTALHGTLRLRASPEIVPARAYGHCFEDGRFDNLHHLIACGPCDTVAFDFDYVLKEGFRSGREADLRPVVQMAFEYTVLFPSSSLQETQGDDAGVYVRQRRRRVSTAQVQVAAGKKAIYESADAEAMLALLAHKVVKAAQREGLEEARLMLTDWLVILAARYAEAYGRSATRAQLGGRRVDAAFSECVPLQAVPRLVYGLLRTAILQPLNVHPDQRTFLASLAAQLEPQSLARVVYPLLCSWQGPDELAFPAHSLSRAALVTSGCQLFLLDAYLLAIVYYAPAPGTGPGDELPFPPPQKVREWRREPGGRRVLRCCGDSRLCAPARPRP